MSIPILITFAIIILAIVLFVREQLSIDTTSILVMSLFIATGVLTPSEGFAGFNHSATITVGCMFVISTAIFKTGALKRISLLLTRLGQRNYMLCLLSIMGTTAVFSAFINDTAVVALLMPTVLQVAKTSKISPSRLLMPLSFGALMGGVCTLIGTSTNILVSGIAAESGMEPFGMFELTKTGLWFLGAGILYMLFAGRWLLPQREVTTELTDAYDMGDYLSEIRVLPEAEDVDKSIATSRLVKDYDIAIINITREDGKITYPLPYTRLRAHDLLKIRCSMDKLQALREVRGIEVKAEKDIRDSDLQSEEMKFYEVLIPPNSRLAGRSLYAVNFRIVYQASVLAIRSRNEILHEKIGHSTLHAGDVLLVLGSEKQMQKVTKGEDLLLLSETEAQQFSFRKMIIVMLIAVAVVVAAAAGITSIVISATIGALLMVLTRSISPEEAYNAIEWKVIFMLAGVLSMGTALEKTGGAAFIAQGIEGVFSSYGNHVMLSVFFLITFLATNVMSNNATAALLAPIAISMAQSMGVSERPFLMAVTFAASLSFMTPMGYQTNTMIYAPGNYRFKDYLIVGTPLNLLLWLLASIIIPMHFPF